MIKFIGIREFVEYDCSFVKGVAKSRVDMGEFPLFSKGVVAVVIPMI